MSYDDEAPQNPFTRPGFIAATVVVAIVLVLGILVAIRTAGNDDPEPPPTGGTEATGSATPEPSAAAAAPSVCGLDGIELEGTVTAPPEAEWAYQGTLAYPTSDEYGPGAADPSGFNYCFQRSPEGALFAAANAIAQGSDVDNNAAWLEYFVAEGPHRDELLSEPGDGTSTTGTRLRVAGFRVLAYDGTSARIDIAGEGSASGGSITFSVVYELVWQAGDWKVSAETATPPDFAVIPDLAGYLSWGA